MAQWGKREFQRPLIGPMFDLKRNQSPPPPRQNAMSQEQIKSLPSIPTPAAAAGRSDWLTMETKGRERLRSLLATWLQRNNWSLAVVSRLAELALLAQADVPVPDWSAGMPLQPGSWVNHRGHVWEALGTPLSEPADDAPGWQEIDLTSRLHASGLNLFLRGKHRTLTSTFLLEIGRCNEWVAAVQAGKASPPADSRLRDLVLAAVVICDPEGPLGPEELLSIALGRLLPPPWPGEAPDSAGSNVPARQLRAAAAAANLDIVDDWVTIAAMYPTSDPVRLELLQQVLRGTGQWGLEREEAERAACGVLLQRLKQHAATLQAAADDTTPAAGTTIRAGEG